MTKYSVKGGEGVDIIGAGVIPSNKMISETPVAPEPVVILATTSEALEMIARTRHVSVDEDLKLALSALHLGEEEFVLVSGGSQAEGLVDGVKASQTKSPLEKIPTEVRLHIFSYVIVSRYDGVRFGIRTEKDGERCPIILHRSHIDAKFLDRALMHTNKMLSSEALQVLYGDNVFNCAFPDMLIRFVKHIGSVNASYIKQLRLYVSNGQESFTELSVWIELFELLAKKATGLKKIEIHWYRGDHSRDDSDWLEEEGEEGTDDDLGAVHASINGPQPVAPHHNLAGSLQGLAISHGHLTGPWASTGRVQALALRSPATDLTRAKFRQACLQEIRNMGRARFGLGGSVHFIRGFAKMKSLKQVTLSGYYAKQWASYLAESLGDDCLIIEKPDGPEVKLDIVKKYQMLTRDFDPAVDEL